VPDAALLKTIPTRAGGEVTVSVRGSGPPLVWVAGLGDDHTSFDATGAPDRARICQVRIR
jgi:hypothetical protein